MSNKKPTMATKLLALQKRFINELSERLDAIVQEWQKCQADTENCEFHRLVHSLAGAAGTFGFIRLGEQAHNLELLIQKLSGSPASPESIKSIDEELIELQVIAKEGPDKMLPVDMNMPAPVTVSGENAALVYVLEDDVGLAEETAQQLQHFGYDIEVFHSTDALQAGVARRVPDALLADIHLPEGTDAGPKAAEELRKGATHEVPVIFVSGHNTWQDRLNAVRAGGQAYLSKPINFTQLVEQLDGVTGKLQEDPYRILIVDDTPLLAEHYATVLQLGGMQTDVLLNPIQILDVLAVVRPDLILMDIYMPGCSGVEAAQVIRQHAAYTNLPIVYLSTEKGLEQQLEALRVGGDDFLQKPISDAHLVAAVRIRARRFRELTSLMNQDSLTGLLNHINLKLTLEREISQAKRRSSALSFVMIDIDHFKSVNDTYGHPCGDGVIKSLARLLNQRLRKGDIAARYGGEEFALVLPDTQAEDARSLIDNLRQEFAEIIYTHELGEFNATFSAGIAVCTSHSDMESLITAADNALYQAKHAGRNQVVVNGIEKS